jgi:two-component system, sensor histidine kinase and response regulator
MNNKKILLVDDEVNLRETITDLLVLNNYNVKTAENGLDALEILDYWIPDLIISDIMMPVMDGYSFHEIVKDSNMLNQIPFVFLTAKNDEEEREKCILNGADLFITKPFKIENLIKTIEVKIERFEKVKNAYNTINASNNNYFIHEINTPLYGILGSINLLIKNKKRLDENEVDLFYNTIKLSGERLNRTLKNSILYRDLKNNELDFSDTSSSEISNEFSKVKDNIANADKNQAKRIVFNVDESNIKIEVEYLHFILFELLDNALKFSENNKKVIVSGKKYNSEYYELTIQDYGIGFTEKEIKEINVNQQFNRDKKEQQGLGLGLIISKIFIKKISGVFSIISQKNVGTTITIYFPLHIDNVD